jgi:hypothetical protein
MADIFISYANEDRDKAEELARLLAERRWTVWWDRQIGLGLSFDEVIERELRACRCAIVLWTARSVASRWVKREARSADKRQVLVPILADHVDPPLEFTDLQAANLATWDHIADHPEFEKVVRRIEELAPRSVGSPTPSGSFATARAERPADATRPQSWIASHRLGSAAVAVAMLASLAAGGFYWATRLAPSQTPEQKRSPESAGASVPAPDRPTAPAAADQPVGKRDLNPATPAAEKKGAREVNLTGFQLSINQTNYFSSKPFEIDDLDLARDFVIGFDIKSTRTGGSTRYGIAWNYQPDDFMLFTLHSMDFYYYSIGTGRSRSQPFARFSEGRLGINGERGFDVLQMSKRGDDLVFSVNGRELWRTSDYRLQSNRFAFWVADTSDAVMKSYSVQQ